LSTVTRPVVE